MGTSVGPWTIRDWVNIVPFFNELNTVNLFNTTLMSAFSNVCITKACIATDAFRYRGLYI